MTQVAGATVQRNCLGTLMRFLQSKVLHSLPRPNRAMKLVYIDHSALSSCSQCCCCESYCWSSCSQEAVRFFTEDMTHAWYSLAGGCHFMSLPCAACRQGRGNEPCQWTCKLRRGCFKAAQAWRAAAQQRRWVKWNGQLPCCLNPQQLGRWPWMFRPAPHCL